MSSAPNALKCLLNVILPSTYRSSKWPLAFRVSQQKPVCVMLLLCTCHISKLAPPPSHHLNYVSYEFKMTKLLIMQFFAVSCLFLHLSPPPCS